MIRFTVTVDVNGVTIADYIGNSGLEYQLGYGIRTHADRETEIKAWNACDEIADAAMEIDRLIGSDAE